MLKVGTSFNIVVTCAAELSGCDYSAEAEIRRAEGEGEIALHGRKPQQPVDTTGGCTLSKDGRGEHSPRNHSRKTESIGSRYQGTRLYDRTSAEMVQAEGAVRTKEPGLKAKK